MGYATIPNELMRCTSIGMAAKLVYGAIQDRVGRNGAAWPSVPTIAADIGSSPSTVKRAIGELVRVGAVTVESRPGRSCRYLVQNDLGQIDLGFSEECEPAASNLGQNDLGQIDHQEVKPRSICTTTQVNLHHHPGQNDPQNHPHEPTQRTTTPIAPTPDEPARPPTAVEVVAGLLEKNHVGQCLEIAGDLVRSLGELAVPVVHRAIRSRNGSALSPGWLANRLQSSDHVSRWADEERRAAGKSSAVVDAAALAARAQAEQLATVDQERAAAFEWIESVRHDGTLGDYRDEVERTTNAVVRAAWVGKDPAASPGLRSAMHRLFKSGWRPAAKHEVTA